MSFVLGAASVTTDVATTMRAMRAVPATHRAEGDAPDPTSPQRDQKSP